MESKARRKAIEPFRTMIKKLVSVILPAYKMGQFIGEAWEPVGGQTYPFWEVLVGGGA